MSPLQNPEPAAVYAIRVVGVWSLGLTVLGGMLWFMGAGLMVLAEWAVAFVTGMSV